MQNPKTPSVSDLIFEIRETGNYGREPGLSQAPKRWANRVIAVRQLEISVCQMAPPWLEEIMGHQELWGFLRSNLLSRAVQCAQFLSETLDDPPQSDEAEALSERDFADAISSTRLGIGWLQTSDAATTDYGCCVMASLVSSMILRQYLENGLGIDLTLHGAFSMKSSNVSERFLDLSLSILGRRPFGIRNGESLAVLVQRVKEGMENELLRGRLGSP